MSDKPKATVPAHLLNSGIDADDPDSQTPQVDAAPVDRTNKPPLARNAQKRKDGSSTPAGRANILPLAVSGVALLAVGIGIGMAIAHRSDNPVLATVNGVPIDRQQYTHRCETTIVNNAAVGPQVLRQMVSDELALQYAAKQGVTPTDAAVDEKYQEASKSANFAENLRKALQTPEDVKHGLKVNMAQSAFITKGVSVSDEEIKAFYKANTDPHNPNARYYRPDAVQVAAIISDKASDIDNAIHDLATGIPFAQVAQKYSKDKSATNGGVLPPIRRGQLNSQKFPGLENQLFALSPNQQIDKIKVGTTYWLVRCIGRSKEASVPFEQVKDECRQGALLLKGNQANGQTVKQDLQDFIKNADIKALQPQYKDAVNINGKQ